MKFFGHHYAVEPGRFRFETKPTVSLIFDIRQGLYVPSCVFVGLDTLDRSGAIDFRIRAPQKGIERNLLQKSSVVYLKLNNGNRDNECLIAIDLNDSCSVFAIGALEACDVYLKRSFYRPEVDRFPVSLSTKVLPFGLNFPCVSRGSTLRLFCNRGMQILSQGYMGIRHIHGQLVAPSAGDFEQPPAAPVDLTVLFQTRVWNPEDGAPGEVESINEDRVGLIRALKEAFGPQFVGGLVPTPLALARYPRDISPHPSRRKLYTAMSKRSMIGVYSRGLHGSTAFKFAEYLAASQCIVAEPPQNESPVPLEAGTNFLPFRNPDECVAACRRLLEEDEFSSRMRQTNYAYYQSEVEPAAHMFRVLQRSIQFSHLDSASRNAYPHYR
jgi:hypothetical protein